MTRLLGVDLGERRIGLAVADDDGSAAEPLTTLRRGRDADADAAALQDVVEARSIGELIVGLPLEAAGGEGPQARLTRAWATDMAARLGIPVGFRDERLSSHLAETRLGPMKRGRSGGPPSKTQRDAYRARVDREAAAIILQDELDTRAGRRSSMPRPPDPPGEPPMTIRSGGRPRDGRATPAHSFDPDAYATDSIPEYSEPIPRPRNGGGGGRGGGLVGFLKFLIFALVLAAIVLAVALTALRPAVGTAVMAVADDNPAVLQLPFVADIVRENLGPALTTPASTDAAQIEFLIESGDTARAIATRLQTEGLITDSRAFVFIATTDKLTGSLQAGTFVLRKNMTPDQLVNALLKPPPVPFVDIALRTGLRLEQITAKLETLPLQMDASEFHDIATSPPAELVADYPWLGTALKSAPKGASLEGFLWPATYRVLPDTTPEELIRLMLDKFAANVGPDRMAVAKDRGLDFYQIVTLASIVEREAQLAEEKPLIAGVYANRLDPRKWRLGLLQSDPTIFYIHDSLELAKLAVPDWTKFVFWAPIKGGLTDETLPADLAGYNTYTSKGLPPGPICTPTLTSIDAALEPDAKDGYLFFLAKGDGTGTTAFAKTLKEHEANKKKYLKPAP